jgi:hypothetical protein
MALPGHRAHLGGLDVRVAAQLHTPHTICENQ